jgi:hypothetical protein
MEKDKSPVVDQDPSAGGCYVRNKDGSLKKVQTQADEKTLATPPANETIETKD